MRVSGGRQEVGVQCWLQTNERKIAMEFFIGSGGVESSFEFSMGYGRGHTYQFILTIFVLIVSVLLAIVSCDNAVLHTA